MCCLYKKSIPADHVQLLNAEIVTGTKQEQISYPVLLRNISNSLVISRYHFEDLNYFLGLSYFNNCSQNTQNRFRNKTVP